MEGYGEGLVSILYLSLVMVVFFFQGISSLVILDLCGNPLACSTKHYRLFVIYHVTSLKALDGLAVVGSFQGLSVFFFLGYRFPFLLCKMDRRIFLFAQEPSESGVAKDTFGGRYVCEKHQSLCELYKL